MERSIDELLNGEPEAAPVVEQEPATEQTPEVEAQADDRPRDEHGRFLPKDATGVEEPQATAEPVPPTEQPSGLPQAEYTALKDERRRRQEAEARAADLEAKWRQVEQQRQQPPPPSGEFNEDAFWTSPKQVFDEYGNRVLGQVEQLVEQRLVAREVARSFTRAKTKYGDFDAVFEEFDRLDRASGNQLTQQALAADDPAEFAYNTARQAREVAQYGSIPQLLAAERAKWEQEARAAMPAPTVTLPSTTATDGSVGGRAGPAWGGPPTIDDILR